MTTTLNNLDTSDTMVDLHSLRLAEEEVRSLKTTDQGVERLVRENMGLHEELGSDRIQKAIHQARRDIQGLSKANLIVITDSSLVEERVKRLIVLAAIVHPLKGTEMKPLNRIVS